LIARAFVPLSFFDTAVVAIVFGLAGFILALVFAPKVRHINHHSATIQLQGVQATASAGCFTTKATPPNPDEAPDEAALRAKLGTWLKVTNFKVGEAATLWGGSLPVGVSYLYNKGQHPEIAAAESLIVGEIKNCLDVSGAVLASIGDYSEARVSRANLCMLAKKVGANPAFLVLGEGWH
jgi:hypothetical protein